MCFAASLSLVSARPFSASKLVFHGPCQPLAQDKAFAAFLRSLFREDWVVYAKPPFGGPEHVLQYLARYTHRVAISNHRLLTVDETKVSFRWKDYAHHNKPRIMALTHEEFLRRFLTACFAEGLSSHSLFRLARQPQASRVTAHVSRSAKGCASSHAADADGEKAVWLCPCCHGPMQVIERLSPARAWSESLRPAWHL